MIFGTPDLICQVVSECNKQVVVMPYNASIGKVHSHLVEL